MDKKWLMYAVAFGLGVVFATRVRTLPFLGSLPSF
jgi:hypothetical protein